VDTVHECDRQTDRRTDRRTDGRTDSITITNTVQRIASHGNKSQNDRQVASKNKDVGAKRFLHIQLEVRGRARREAARRRKFEWNVNLLSRNSSRSIWQLQVNDSEKNHVAYGLA